MRDKLRLLRMTKLDTRIGKKPVDGKTMFDEPTLFIDLIEAQNQMVENFRNKCLESNIRWLLGFENYVNDKDRTIAKSNRYKNYKKGTIVFVDLFGNFGREYTYDHPAIVLRENKGLLVIAPLTSNPGVFLNADAEASHIKLPSGDKTLGDRRANSTILLEQLRTVSKNRVIKNQVFGRVSDNQKLREIDLAVIEYLAKYTNDSLIEGFEDNIKAKEQIIIEKDDIINSKEEEIEELKKIISEYKSKEKEETI